MKPEKHGQPMIEIDGSYGEGGGQILRTALSLSCLLQKPLRIFNIRRGRKKRGLMPQHLMCIHALSLISHAEVAGASRGSTELVFKPSGVKNGDYVFDIGTAGSTSLLLQAILPPLLFLQERSTLTLRGGTHVPFSPPFDHIRDVFVPMLERLGLLVEVCINQYGFYPKGGGEITIRIFPSKGVRTLGLLQRGTISLVKGVSCVSNLPLSIAERQKNAVLSRLAPYDFVTDIETKSVPSCGQGTFVFLKAETEQGIAGFSSLGARGKRAEQVGDEASKALVDYYVTDSALGPYLADQIVLYLSLAGGASSFTTSRLSDHLLTNLWAIEKCIGLRYTIQGKRGCAGKVSLHGKKISF